MTEKGREGLLYGIASYSLWGLVPLYFRPLADQVPADEVLAQRIVWPFVFLALLVTAFGRWRDLGTCLGNRRLVAALLASSCRSTACSA
jgi:chloramphenicol-sensitive protein RarD